jgi:hypothetical protein
VAGLDDPAVRTTSVEWENVARAYVGLRISTLGSVITKFMYWIDP